MQYNITLNRAHKIVDRLRQHVTETSKTLRSQAAPVRVRSQQDVGAKLRVETRQAEFADQLAAYGLAVDALEQLRNAISKANVANGVDVLLAKQNRITQELKLVKELVEDASLDQCIAWDHVPTTPSDYAHENLASITAEQGTLLNQRVRELQTDLHSVSDRVSDANRASVTVDLSDEHAQIVGLKA